MWLPLVFGCVVGLSLGLTGGGGSIFAVPLLVYGLGLGLRHAVAMSLAVVGVTALYGAIIQARRGLVLWGAGAILGVGGIIAAPFGAALGARMPDRLSLLLFSGLMIFIGVRMLRKKGGSAEVPLSWASCQRMPDGKPHFTLSCGGKLLAAGVLTGVLSGIFGVGGGFIVVPALLIVTCVSMESALATSLVGIFLIAAAGFWANAGHLASADAPLALWFLVGSVVGMTFGATIKTFLPSRALQVLFGVSVLATSAYIIFRNFNEN